MNGSTVAAVVRGWVDLYTRGMLPDVRAARRDEVNDDVWCQQEEATALGRSPGSVAREQFLRLVLGIPADLSWRMSQGEQNSDLPRVSSISTRVFGTLAVLAGVSWIAMMIGYLFFGDSAWNGSLAPYMAVFVVGGGLAFSATAFGLLWRFQEQLQHAGVIGATTAGLGGIASAFHGEWAIGLLPIGSLALLWDLARLRVVSEWVAVTHAVSAVALLAVLLGAFRENSTAIVVLVLVIGYPLSWITIGASLMRGIPQTYEQAPSI